MFSMEFLNIVLAVICPDVRYNKEYVVVFPCLYMAWMLLSLLFSRKCVIQGHLPRFCCGISYRYFCKIFRNSALDFECSPLIWIVRLAHVQIIAYDFFTAFNETGNLCAKSFLTWRLKSVCMWCWVNVKLWDCRKQRALLWSLHHRRNGRELFHDL